MKKINFTEDEIYWVERSADIEASYLLYKFFEIVSIPKENISKTEMVILQKMVSEIIDSYLMLKELRIKLEHNRHED